MVSLYEILEVSPNASAAVIKAAYRCLVQLHHPDKNAGDRTAEARLSLINQAYAVLADPLMRAKYDAKAGFAKADRRGSGRTLAPAKPGEAAEAPKVRRFAFRAVA